MKKHILLFFVGILCSIGAMAQVINWTPVKTTQMNPFAYNLSATLNANQSELTIKYCLNADVKSLKIVITDGAATVTHDIIDENKLKKTTAEDPYLNASAPHIVTIPTQDLPKNTELTWRIEVKGEGRANCGVYSLDGTNVYRHKFYRPSSVDIVQDPTSFNYGKVLVVESQHQVSSLSGYHSSPKTKTNGSTDKQGAGIYVFNPDLTPRENTSGTYVFNGKDDSRFANTSYSPHRVRVSDDGRMFVTSMDHTKGAILWEIDNYFSTWTTVMGKGVGGATYSNSTYDLKTSGGSFIAGPNAGFDVKGSGSELTLLMLSCDYTAINANNQTGFECREYNLGTATTWSSAAGKNFNTNSRIFVDHCNSNVQYDENGGIWCISYREICKDNEPGLVHKTAAGVENCRMLRSNTKNAALRFNKTFTRAMMASEGNYGVLYDYIPDHGSNNASQGYFFNHTNIDMSAVGTYLNDFAWDNANNIYAVGQNDGVAGGNGYVVVYCLPYDANNAFITPGPSEFTIDCQEGLQYMVTTTVNDHAMGSVIGGGSIQSCELTTLTAAANDGYRFVNWTVGGNVVSEANPYKFIVTKDVEVQANFAPAVFNVTWWNLFQNGEDISDKNENKNTKLWYLFMPYYNVEGSDKDRSLQNDFATGEHNVVGFCNTSTKTLLEDSDGPLYWLGQYIKSVVVNHSQLLTGYSNYNKCMFAFINRVGYAKNSSGYQYTTTDGYTTPSYLIDTLKRFANASVPSLWRPYWTNYACDLPSTIKYEDDLPVSWKQIDGPSSEYQEGAVTGTPTKTPSWYKWNTGKPNQLLAWREGDSITGPIVHQVDHDMALYASYVDRHISEVIDNTDVIRLMQNSGYKNNPHALTVDRKLQAGMYNTICFPFTVYINDEGGKSGLAAGHPLKGSTVLKLIGKDELYDESGEPVVVLNFEQVNKLEAGKPYLIKLAENQGSITLPINFTGVAYDDLTYINGNHTITIDDATISFHAMISPGDIPAESVILVADNRLAVTTVSGQMNGLRGYFTINDEYLNNIAKAGRLYLSVKKPTTTSIPIAPEAEQPVQPKVRKVMHDGKIYILRGDEVYTITGARVK